MKEHNYIAVFGWMVKLGLSGTDLLIYGMIYGFSQDGQSYFTGSLKYVQEWLSVSKSTAMRSIDKLVEMGLVIKESETRNNITFNRYKVDETVVSKCYRPIQNDTGGGVNLTLGGGVNLKPNNTIIDNTIKKEKSFAEQNSLFPELAKETKTLFKNSLVADFEKFKKHFEGAEFQEIDIYHYFVSAKDWSDSKNQKRTANGWLATVRTWIRNDLNSGKLKKKKQEGNSDFLEYLKMSNGSY